LAAYKQFRWIGVFLILWGLEAAGAALAGAEAGPVLVTLDVQGNTRIASETILGAVSNSRIGFPLDSREIQRDLQAIMALGYFRNVRFHTEEMLDGVKLIFEVTENPTFREVRLTGLTEAEPGELLPYFSQKPGTIFNAAAFQEDLAKALKACREKKGLLIEPRSGGGPVLSEDGVVRVELRELRYGKVTIAGLVKTKEVVIRRELSAREGALIDLNRLKEDISNLYRLRLFEEVVPDLRQSAVPDALDLALAVKEVSGTAAFTPGISVNDSTHQLTGLVSFSESNLMGLGQSIALDADFSSEGRNVQFNFYEPWLTDKHASFGLAMWNTRDSMTSTMRHWGLGDNDRYDLDRQRLGISLSFGYPISRYVSGRIKFNFERNEIHSYWPAGSDHSQPSLPLAALASPGAYRDHSIEFGLAKDRLLYQDPYFVGGGYRLSADWTVAGQYLGGAYDYQKTVLEGKWFHPFRENLVFATRLQGAYLAGEYPDYDALYLGGMYKLRGYEDDRFENAVTRQLIGEGYLLANAELRYRFPADKKLKLVLFYDVGQLLNGDDTVLKSDYGIGFRYNVPILGQIRLDQARNSDHDVCWVFSMNEQF
jgi:outer membrane protein insertion porin family